MTTAEKIGQLTLVEKNSIKADDIAPLGIGGLLSGGGGYPLSGNSAEGWAAMVDGYQKQALSSRLGIPIIYGVDAVHGHGNLREATIFPHNIGLGATRDADLVERIGKATAVEMIATGIYWNYAPAIPVVQDIRWGRAYESYGEDTALVTMLGAAYLKGLQGEGLGTVGSVLATPKHYLGDGGTSWGTSKTDNYKIDQGDVVMDEATLRRLFLPPYQATIEAGAMSVMVSFSSWNGVKMHGQAYLLTEVLKGELGFKGFIVSDWAGVDQVSPDYAEAVIMSINAGVDMNMVPYDYQRFIRVMEQAIADKRIPLSRLDDAVRRILTVKFQMALFERPYADRDQLSLVGSAAHRAIAREAVTKSLVLLQNNDRTLPLPKDTAHIFVAGRAADDIGLQSGGWTIEWQGKVGDITPGTTVLEAVQGAVSASTQVHFDRLGRFRAVNDAAGNPLIAEVGLVVVGEDPYAEGKGDSDALLLSEPDRALIARMRERSKKLVVILFSGRPLVITEDLKRTDAFIAAWLPGTEGHGITDALFGDKPFTGKLPFSWPRAMSQLPFDFAKLRTLPAGSCDGPLFAFGDGLDVGTLTRWQDTCS
jgi:beta-glucosidase